MKWKHDVKSFELRRQTVTDKSEFCSQNSKIPSVMVIGDSHSDVLYRGLAEQGDIKLLNMGEGACLPFYGIRRTRDDLPRDCVDQIGRVLDLAVNDPAIKVVVLSSMGPGYLYGDR